LAGLFSQRKDCALEVIIVDDASADTGIRDVADAFGCVYLRMSQHRGSAYCKNAGMLLSHGEIVWFLDSDVEFLSTDTMSNMVKIIFSMNGCGVVGGEAILDSSGALRFIFGRNIDRSTGKSRPDYFKLESVDSGGHFVEYDYVPTSNCMISKEVALTVGGFDDAYPTLGEDKDFGYRVQSLGLRTCVSRDTVVQHRFSQMGRTANGLAKVYRTQLRFVARHFGLPSLAWTVIDELKNINRSVVGPRASINSQADEIREFERHYVQQVLGLSSPERPARRDFVVRTWQLASALVWVLWNRKGLTSFGSYRLPELQQYRNCESPAGRCADGAAS
jgi:GT2 family glycosyltransferase